MLILAACTSCADEPPEVPSTTERDVIFMTLDPGHFHAGLIHKYDYDQVGSTVYVYAPDGEELESHLALVEQFNTRSENPTHWALRVYRGEDYLERMLEERPGNVMVVAGDNGRKIEYIRRAVQEGIHVLADKPLVIHPDSFRTLKETLETADEQGLLVYDIMTERHVVATVLQRELSRMPDLFGELVQGSPDEPAISKESVHHFYKTVAGKPLVRPAWFFDVNQQGEGIVDVSTHLVDLILWQAFPDEPIDYQNPDDGVEVIAARSWDTRLTPDQFTQVTNEAAYPDYLLPYMESDSTLRVAANGEFTFTVRGVHARVSTLWDYENPEGGDTHYSIMRGTRANLIIRQDEKQDYRPTLYVEPAKESERQHVQERLDQALDRLSSRYQGLAARPAGEGWEIIIPEVYREGHEEHFTRVAEQYLDYLEKGHLPDWERANLLTKYFITTRAYALSRQPQ